MTDVLVDDYTKNLKEWPVFGDAKFGRAVKLLNGINGTNGTWTGISVSRFFTPKSIADVILSRAADVGLAACGREGGALIASKHFTQFSTCKARKCVV